MLSYAIQSDMLDLVMFCLESGCNADVNTALKISCINNNLEMMTNILQCGADIHVINGDDFEYINLPTIKFLIEHKFSFKKTDMSKVFRSILFFCMYYFQY